MRSALLVECTILEFCDRWGPLGRGSVHGQICRAQGRAPLELLAPCVDDGVREVKQVLVLKQQLKDLRLGLGRREQHSSVVVGGARQSRDRFEQLGIEDRGMGGGKRCSRPRLVGARSVRGITAHSGFQKRRETRGAITFVFATLPSNT